MRLLSSEFSSLFDPLASLFSHVDKGWTRIQVLFNIDLLIVILRKLNLWLREVTSKVATNIMVEPLAVSILVVANAVQLIEFVLVLALSIKLSLLWRHACIGCHHQASVLVVRNSRNETILSIVVVFVGLQIVPVHGLLNTSHVAVHLKLVVDLQLLVEHVLILLLIYFLGHFFIAVNLSVVGRLQPCLVLVELVGIVQATDVLLLFLLHLELVVVQLLGL
jgi:hypothetical protein